MMTDSRPSSASLRELARLFVKLGTVAFGGPAAHIAMMEDEVVRRRHWLSHEEFLDYVGVTNLIPGPNSTELALHVGMSRAGWAGLLVAGTCFILPAALIVAAIAWAYVRFGSLPAATGLLYGVKPVVIAVVLQALWGLGRSALKTRGLVALGIGCLAAAACGVNELAILAAAAVVMIAARSARTAGAPDAHVALTLPAWGHARFALREVVALSGAGVASFGLWPLFGVFLKIGAVLFGSGYVLLAFLRADLVQRLGWLTEQQLLDAVAVGQITPGPVFTTATFIGYVLGGGTGAAVATVGIFLPAFVFVAISAVVLPRLRRSPTFGAALDGVNVASLALMADVSVRLGHAALVDALTMVMAALCVLLLLRFRINSAWLVLAGAAIGMIMRG